MTPAHYDKPVTPWDLQCHMDSSGDLFIDARRTDIIEYAFRIKSDLRGDLEKIKANAEAAIQRIDAIGEDSKPNNLLKPC